MKNLPIELPVPDLLNTIAARFERAGIASPRAEAEWLLAALLQGKRSGLYLDRRRVLAPDQRKALESFFHRRLQREPLQYIAGQCEFFGREFKVTPSVLIPRPETEILVEKVIVLMRNLAAPRIIDLGTGSGCIALTLASELPRARIMATDISAAALEIARENAQRLNLTARVEFRETDMCAPVLSSHLSRFDIVVSNPPYVLAAEREQLPPEVREYEPGTALYVEGDGLKFYRCLLEFCGAHLDAGGWVACEMASQRSAAIAELFRSSFLSSVEIIRDYAGHERHLIGRKV